VYAKDRKRAGRKINEWHMMRYRMEKVAVKKEAMDGKYKKHQGDASMFTYKDFSRERRNIKNNSQ
jgi:hypothetical protein